MFGFQLDHGDDGWVWRLEENGVFSVKLAYEKLKLLMVFEDNRNVDERRGEESV